MSVLAALVLVASASPAWSQVPSLLNFSGRLGTEAGDFTGVADVTLTLYDDAASADASHVLWADTQDVFVDAGRFHLLLGADPGNPLPDGLLTVGDLYVGVSVNGEAEMTPRMRVASVPFALYAADSTMLAGKGPDAFAAAGHGHAFAGITGTVSATQLPGDVTFDVELAAGLAGKSDVGHDHDGAYVNEGQAGSVTTEMVLDRTLLPVDLADWGCANGQVAKWTAGAPGGWGCGDDVDTDTKYLPGTGLKLDGATFNVDETVIRGWCYDAPTELYSFLDTRYAASSHDHDTLYYRKSEIDSMLSLAMSQVQSMLALKADKLHAHATGDVTGLQTVLDGKAAVAHGHVPGEVTGLQASVEGWAKGVCYDTQAELSAALTGWDTKASDDLLVDTAFGGDVTGVYSNLQIASGAVGNAEIADAARYVSVQNSAGTEQFAVTDGAPALQFAGGGATTVSYDAATHRVTISSTDTTGSGDITAVYTPPGSGLTGGGGAGELTLSADTNYLQRRIAVACPAGQFIGSVAADGTPTCLKAVTSLTTGNGLINDVSTGNVTIQVDRSQFDGWYVNEGQNASVSNSMLVSPSLTVQAGTGLTGGGSVSLGGTTTLSLSTPVTVPNGGTGAGTAGAARTNLGAAASGVNFDLTGLMGLNTQAAVVLGPYATTAGATGEARFLELVANGMNYTGFKAPDVLGANMVYTLPSAAPAAGQVLASTSTGVLSWTTPSSAPVTSVFGRTGAVTAQAGDYTTTQVTEGTNLYYTDARAVAAITGGASTIATSNLTASRALVSDGAGKVAASGVTSTELGYLSGVTSAIQTQLNGKMASPMTTLGDMIYGGAAGAPARLAGTPGFLKSTGAAAPTWSSIAATDLPTHSHAASDLSSGVLPIARGGTNTSTAPTAAGVVYGTGASYASTPAGASTQVLKGGAGGPSWGQVALATDVSGTLPAANGGTGFSTYSVGNLLVADTTSSLAKLAPVASGNVLRSEGVGVVPSWGKVNLQNHTAGVLLPGNGGTGIAVAGPAGSVAYSDGSYFAFNSQGLNGQYLKSSGTGAPVWGGIAAADLPSTSNAYIQNQVLAQQDAEFSIDGNGLIGRSLGVGTTSPTARLHVAGGTVTSTTDPMTTVDVSQTFGFAPTADVAVTGIRSVVASATQASSYQVIPQAIEGSTFVTGNAAGIEYALGVVGKTTNSSAGSLGYAYGVSGLAVNGSSGSIYSAVGVYGEASGYTGSVTTAYGGKFTAYSSVATTNVGIQAHATGGVNNYAALFTGGSVGIGTTTPQTTLDVSGSGSFSGTLTVGGAPVLTASLVQVPKGNTVTTIASVGAVATDVSSVSLTIGADGLPVASFFDWTRSSLRVAKCTNAACSSFTVPAPPAVDDPSVGNVGWYNSIAISTDGMPVISYYEDNRGAGTLQNVVVSKCASVDCSTLVNGAPYVVDSTGDVGKHTSLAIGTDGLPVIAYQDVTNTNLKVAKCGNVACTLAGTYTIDGGGRRAAIAIGTDGYPVVSYVGSAGSGLKVAKCASASCAALAAGSPTVIDADAGDLVNQYQSLTIGADGLPVLAFDSYNGGTNTWALKVAKCADAACLTQVSGSPFTVESSTTGDVARHESITVGADGLPIIAYYGVPTNSLKVVKCGNAACQSGNSIVTIDSMGAIAFNAGPCTSITIGVDGLPVIAYLTAATNSLKIAKCTNPFCIPYWTRR
jgi:hypothetical protein